MSLLVFAAVVVMWMRSYFVDDDAWWWGQRSGVGVMTSGGRVALWQGNALSMPPVSAHRFGLGYERRRHVGPLLRTPGAATYWAAARLGFGAVDDAGHRWRIVSLPHALFAAAAAVLPIGWMRAGLAERRQRRRQSMGLCPACGYDLIGNVSGVCPECGAGAAGDGNLG
jgi:hypothetical protein